MSTFGSGSQEQEQGTNIRAKSGELLMRLPFEKDKVIFREGHDGTDAYVLESGRVGVFKNVEGKAVRLAVLEKGAMFGEMAAITGERRTATTIALEPCVVVRIAKSTMKSKIAACDPFVRALIAILINNVSRVNERYATTSKVAEKLLNDLKTAQAAMEKPDGKSETPQDTPPIDETRGPRGADGGVSG